MPQGEDSIYDTFIDHEQSGANLDVHSIADYQAIQRTAGEDFQMQKRELGEVLSDRVFNIPEYQRLFSWREKQHRQLWSDLQQFTTADLGRGEPDISDVFFSSMYFAVDNQSDTYEVIDGQQRLTSIHILLRTILEGLENLEGEEFNEEFIEQVRANTVSQIEGLLYTFEGVATGYVPRLTLNKHDDDRGGDESDLIGFFEALISGSEKQADYLFSDNREYIDGRRGDATRISTLIDAFDIEDDVVEARDAPDWKFSKYIPVYNSNERLLDAYSFYRDRISELLEDGATPDDQALALINLCNYILNSYHVGEFRINNAAPDFRMQIFEILNDRGLELTKIDRIRAVVVNAFFEADDRKKYIKKWEDIVVAFATDESRIDQYLSVYLSIVDDNIDTVGEASAELTNAFGTQNLESDVSPRFHDLDDARDFLDHAHELISYYKDLNNSNLEPGDLALSEHRDPSQEVIVRLNDQRMSQWRPFALALYYQTSKSSQGNGEAFYRTLDTIEKLNFRRLLVGEDPNIFQEIFLDAVHSFSLAPGSDVGDDFYEAPRRFLIEEIRSSNPSLFADRFSDTIVQSQAWNPQSAKLLFGKIAHQWFRKEGSIVDRRLDMSSIHLEHVLPQSLVHDEDDPVWLREFFRLEDGDAEIADAVRRYIDLRRRDDETLSEEERQYRDSVEEFIRQRFVNDIGNFVLLRDSDNIKASNRPLSQKIPQYFNTEDDFSSIRPNQYFTRDSGPMDQEKLERLLDQADTADGDSVDDELIDYFDSFWTYDGMKDRRVDLLIDILDALQLDTLDDEFGIESNPTAVRDRVQSQTEQEFEKRLSMSSF